MPDQQNSQELQLRSELIKSLKRFQANCPAIPKDKSGFNYKYAPLENMLSIINPALHREGLVQNQTYDFEEGRTIIITTLFHENGDSISSRTPLLEPQGKNPKKDICHEWGGITTYSRRYAIKMILGIEPDMDMNMEDIIDRGVDQAKTTSHVAAVKERLASKEKPSPWKKPELEGIDGDDQPLSTEERNLLLGLIKENPHFEKFCEDFRKEFDLTAKAKIAPHIKTRRHERFVQQWNN